jgi:hypothetical protein
MTDATATTTAHPGAEAHIDNTAKPQDTGASHSWAADFASSVWGAAKVVGTVVEGAADEVIEHPLKAAAEVATGLAVGVVAAEAGIGVVAAAAVGGVALAAYGAVRGIEIARTEGVGAIPAHMKQAYEDVKHSAGNVLNAASTIYHGEKGAKADQAAAELENVGRGVVPLVLTAVGGAGAELGQMALRGGAQVLGDFLPALTFEPAYAYAGGGIVGGAIATTPARVGAESVIAAEGAGVAMKMADGSEGNGGNMSDYDRQQHFIDGKKVPGPVEAPAGAATEIGKGFEDIDNVMKNGGVRGNFKFSDDGNGSYSVKVTGGPLAGRTAIWQKGDAQFHMDLSGSGSTSFDLP